jgi:hypothetical protein
MLQIIDAYTNALGEDQPLSHLYAECTLAGRNIDALCQTVRLTILVLELLLSDSRA